MKTKNTHQMKQIVTTLLIGILLIPAVASAQKVIKIDGYQNEEINTLFKREKRDGFYFSSTTAYSPINGDNGLVQSARFAWIMDHWFAFGFVGTGFVNNLDHIDNFSYTPGTNDKLSLAGGYGGLLFEPILFPLKPLHISFPIVLGAGGVAAVDDFYGGYITEDDADIFYAVEPGVELEINFTKWMRFAIYGSYRYTSDIQIENIATDALRNYSVGATVKIGLF